MKKSLKLGIIVTISNILLLLFNLFIVLNIHNVDSKKESVIGANDTSQNVITTKPDQDPSSSSIYLRDNEYKLFYGTWTVNKVICGKQIRGITFDIIDVKKFIGFKIKYSNYSIEVNGQKKVDNPNYCIAVVPNQQNITYIPGLPSFGELGFTGPYVSFVTANHSEDLINEPFKFTQFYIKDDNTLILFDGGYLYELKRISHLEDAELHYSIPG